MDNFILCYSIGGSQRHVQDKSYFVGILRAKMSELTAEIKNIQVTLESLDQCFSTFFDLRHPSLAIEQFGGTPGYNLPVNRLQV